MAWYPLFTSGSEENEDKEFVLADLMQRNAGAGRLREMLSRPEPVLAPGAYDASRPGSSSRRGSRGYT